MFVGHGLLAFAIAALGGRRLDLPRERAFVVGFVAALFAIVPDVDVVYAPVGLLLRSVSSLGPDVFWETANVIHRGPTHSLVMGGLLAVAVALWTLERTDARLVAVAILGALVGVATVGNGSIGGVVTAVYALAGLGVARYASRRGLGSLTVFAAASVGLLSHPFGDLFTGSPPPFLYPFDLVLVTDRIALHPDPTANLLAAFVLELGTVWLAVWTYTRLRDGSLLALIHPRAALGAGYAVAAVTLPAPTLEQSAHFVFSVLAISVVGAPVRPFSRDIDWLGAFVTGLAAVTIAALAYALAYGVI